jgi:hypothetical protein
MRRRPDPIGLNSVVGLPDGGSVTTNFRRAGRAGRGRTMAGRTTRAGEWHTGTGWKIVPRISRPSRLAISKDGKRLYIGGAANRSFARRAQTPVKKDAVQPFR